MIISDDDNDNDNDVVGLAFIIPLESVARVEKLPRRRIHAYTQPRGSRLSLIHI